MFFFFFFLVERKSRKDIVDDERKSVRFNLEKTPQISFEIPSPTKEESENVLESVDNDISLKQETEEKQEARQIDIDFDDLDICLSEEKSEKLGKEAERVPMDSIKTVEPKKFKPSQMLVKEFREIFENKTKNNINLLGISQIENAKNSTRISSRSNSSSSRSTTSQSEDNPHFSQETKPCEKDKANQAENSVDLSIKETDCKKPNDEKLHSSVFDSTFEDLVDFAIKKKLGVDSPKDDESKILYRERDFLLEEILKGNDSDSVNESDGDNILISESKEMEYLEKLESQINLSAQKRRELEDLVNYEKNKNEKLNEMEREFKIWFEEAEESFKQKKEEASIELNKKYESWLQEQESEFEKTFRQKCKDEMESRMKELKNELAISENLELEALKSRLDLEQKERLQNLKLEIEEREAKELDSLRKSFEDNLNERKTELLKKHREEIVKIEQNLEDVLSGT